jgi:hypothetical protein
MKFDDFRRRADMVRRIPLETVLTYRGATRDRYDRAKWHSEQGPLSVTGAKFTNWQRSTGGGGAIDLVMHLAGVDCGAAVTWLEQHLGVQHAAARPPAVGTSSNSSRDPSGPRPLRLPAPAHRKLARVRRYLIHERGLAAPLLEPLLEAGKVYADRRANAVFLMVAGKANRPIGAELRGTGKRPWHGTAPGSRKDLGYFWVGAKGSRKIVLCESAIDAISSYQLLGDCICISTSGARSDVPWLHGLIARDYDISCGFDRDAPGELAANDMIALHPSIHRLRPPAHDWNAALAASR